MSVKGVKINVHDEKSSHDSRRLILLTGATGYVGARLLRELERQGRKVRCLARRPEMLSDRTAPETEVVAADVLDPGSLEIALDGVDTAYYLVHSMGASGSFAETDRQAARNFAVAAGNAGVRRIIYLGGLGDDNQALSSHLRSRHEVGEILRSSGVQTIEFRASIVIGSGSLSFEMIRALVERLPVMIAPRWVSVLSQPISISDLLKYLSAVLSTELSGDRVFEIGGTDQVSYGDLMREYARQRGLRRLIIPVPVLTPRLSSLWLGLVTPLYARVGRKLIESICHPTIVRDKSAAEVFDVVPSGYREAIRSALRNEDRECAESRWSDALSSSGAVQGWAGVKIGSRFVDSRTIEVNRPAAKLFAAVERIGGQTGWYFTNWLWGARSLMDLAVGGVGMRRGRSHPERLRVGNTLDCWRVEAIEPGRRLLLAAEMKLPGRAWLEFEVTGNGQSSQLRQTAIFDAQGLLGRAYWYSVFPLHQLVFAGMLRGIAAASQNDSRISSQEKTKVRTQFHIGIFIALALITARSAAAMEPAGSENRVHSTSAKETEFRQKPDLPPGYIEEGPLPEGFPPPSPVGQIVEKTYPHCRTYSAEGDGAFAQCFVYLTKHKHEMTAPVILDYRRREPADDKDKKAIRALDGVDVSRMHFVLERPALDEPKTEGSVVVADTPKTKVLSIAHQGPLSAEVLEQLEKSLAAHIENQRQLVAIGAYRVLGYNSPFVAKDKAYWEVQIPVK